MCFANLLPFAKPDTWSRFIPFSMAVHQCCSRFEGKTSGSESRCNQTSGTRKPLFLEAACGEQWCKQTKHVVALIISSVVFDFLDHGTQVCGEEGVYQHSGKFPQCAFSFSFENDSSCPLVCNIFSVRIHLSVVYSSSVGTQRWAESLLSLNW